MKLVIGITVTDRYCFAIKTLARAISLNLKHATNHGDIEAHIAVAGDGSPEVIKAVEILSEACLKVSVHRYDLTDLNFGEAYKEESQLSIAKMEAKLFDFAVAMDADYFWSVEPDIIPPANALRCLLDAVKFDDGYYDIAMATYPSQGGGSFLGGNGTPHHPIAQDFAEEERDLTDKYKELKEAIAEEEKKTPLDHDKLTAFHNQLREELNKCPPTGNVFYLNAKKWRRRGWFDYAYPGIGKGAIVPTDWTGMGCTLLTRKALALANFYGYEGKGTQDLYLTWHKWHPHGLRSAVVAHCPCSHVCRERKEDGTQDFDKLFLLFAFHEEEGETRGHLRVAKRDFVDF